MRVILELTGRTGLVFHNIRMSDPLDPYVRGIKEITDKRSNNRTEADLQEIARLEWYGGLYHDPDIGVYVPSANVLACLREAGKITRDGKSVLRAVAPVTDRLPLRYEHDTHDLGQLFASPAFMWRASVGVGQQRVWRVRPIFRQWSLEFEAELADDILDPEKLQQIALRAGRSEGLGDARVLGYGRFHVAFAAEEPGYARAA